MKLFDVQWSGTVAAETVADAEGLVEDAIARNGWFVELDNCSADLADDSDPDGEQD